MDANTEPTGFALWMPSRAAADVWEPPGGWDMTWGVEEKYSAALARAKALAAGWSEADAGAMAVMSVNLRVMKGLRYSQIWMGRLAAAGLA